MMLKLCVTCKHPESEHMPPYEMKSGETVSPCVNLTERSVCACRKWYPIEDAFREAVTEAINEIDFNTDNVGATDTADKAWEKLLAKVGDL